MMNIIQTPIPGVVTVQSVPVADHRGEFRRLFCERELAPVLAGRKIVQANHSLTRQAGALRGLHFQYPPHAEMKLVRCVRGRVFDVAVDLRENSPTFLKWHAEELAPENSLMMVIPEGCAHGFQTLTADCELLYLHTNFYERSAEGGLKYDDPMIAIAWPQSVTDISDRDRSYPGLSPFFKGLHV